MLWPLAAAMPEAWPAENLTPLRFFEPKYTAKEMLRWQRVTYRWWSRFGLTDHFLYMIQAHRIFMGYLWEELYIFTYVFNNLP